MPAQDGTGNPNMPLPAIDENPTPGVPTPPSSGGPAEAEVSDVHQQLLQPNDNGRTASNMGELLYADQLRNNADAIVKGGLEDIAFDEDGVQQVINRLIELYEKLALHRDDDAPALKNILERNDPVSSNYAFAANRGGQAYLESLDAELSELEVLIEDLRTIKHERLWLEEQHAEEIERQG
ncbi:hypothetical protein [Haloechinothrix sp. LS1_15]|uniref:hypothetical protein n=1 Tax=Haloechinothrix sp. LS1_15 TaxID=2652248 RepID=UPI002946AA75|nr:hypothetical protein [Haloechinothrix sp. LS1_15]MDV6012564.1 hypothetical protein [Haloechinothrix sp. LS1_15]